MSLARLLAFNTMALTALLVNQAAFALAHQLLHYLPAAVLGNLTAAVVNYALSHRVIFRSA